MNKVMLIGNLGKEPEMRYTPAGQAVCNFNVATTERWQKDGQKKERTEWHKIVVWGKLAEICGQYLSKGSKIFLEGKLQTRSWEGKDGVRKYTTEIVADSMEMLGGKKATEPANEDIPF